MIRKRKFPIVGERRRRLVVRPHRRRRDGDGGRRRARRARDLQRRRRRAGAGARVAARGWRARSAPASRCALPRWVGRLARRRGRGRHDDRGARRVEREGEARAGLAAALPELAPGLRRTGSAEHGGSRCLRGAAAAGVRDRLPDARQRERGGGRGAGGLPPPPPRRQRGRADRVAARLPVDRRHPARDRRAALGPGAARDLRRRVAARAAASPTREDDPARHAEIADSLSLAFLVLLESLSPEQRAVFLLREVFDYPYDRIAEIVGKSEADVRQLAVRARRHVDERPPRFDASREQRERARRPLLRRGAGGRPAGARGAAGRGRGAARRRRRQGAGARRALFGRARVARTLGNWLRTGSRSAA